jgi:hypothetical protein
MLLSGSALIGTITVTFTVHGEPHEWHLSVKTAGGAVAECETQEGNPWALLDEMLVSALDTSKKERQGVRR